MNDAAPQALAVRTSTRHRWGEAFTRLEATPSGCPESEKVCVRCGMTCFTVHAPRGFDWHEWQAKGQLRVQLDQTPPCLSLEDGEST